MRQTARPLALVAAATCLLIGVSACSSSSSAKPASAAQLQKIVLQQPDLPAGFTAKAAQPDSSGDATDQQLAACTGISGIKQSDQLRKAQSQDFSQGELTYSSDASTYKNQSAVDNRVKVLQSPKVNTCINTLFKTMLGKQLGSSANVTGSTVTITQGSNGGPKNVVAVANGSITISAQGQNATVNIYAAFITGPLITGTVQATSLNKPIDSKTRDAAVAAVAKRANNP